MSPSNQFFETNKLMPWIKVTAIRMESKECLNQEEGENKICLESLRSGKLLREEFDGHPFEESDLFPIHTSTDTITQDGNNKQLKIIDDQGKVIFKEQLLNKIF